MIRISDILSENQIELVQTPADHEELVYRAAILMRDAESVKDWQGMYDQMQTKDCCIHQTPTVRLCIPHVRTNCVATMAMGVSCGPLAEDGETSGIIQYTFAIGVPLALASDYLRIIGALARIFKNDQTELDLRNAATPEEFLGILVRCEMAL